MATFLPRSDHRKGFYGSMDSTNSSVDDMPGSESANSLLSDGSSDADVKFDRRQWILLIVIVVNTLTSSFAVCLFPPFFPRLAEEKGESAKVYGFIIGTNCLTSFLVTPIIGKNIGKFGMRFSLVGGTLMGGACCALSGFLQFFLPGWSFVLVSVWIRIIHAVGNALVITATFTYAGREFHNAVGKIFSITRTAMNLGQLLGPLIGGALYQVGGFYLPFVAMGAVQAAMGLFSLFLLPESQDVSKSKDPMRLQLDKKITIGNILCIPTIWFSFVTFVVATVCNGFLSINLEPKVLRRFHLTPLWIGLMFGVKDGANSLSSPIWGYICDRCGKTSVKPYIVVSAVLVAFSFMLMGAGAVFGIDISLTLNLLFFVLFLNGIGVGGEQVVGVVDALHEAENAGYPDDPAIHGIVAGLWSSFSGAGRFISRVGSGVLVDWIGFDYTAAIVTAFQGVIAIVTLIYMILCECSLKRHRIVRWNDVTIIEEGSNDELVFRQSGSPSESLMGKTISVDVPNRKSRRGSQRTSRSLPFAPYRRRRESVLGTSAQLSAHSLISDAFQ